MAGVWKRDGTVAVTNGSKKVTGTGTTFADTKNGVAKGHLFCITSGTSVDFYEVDYAVSNTELYLVQAYRGVTATGKAYEVITTFSDSVPEFARRLTATLSAYQQQSDAFQALLTSDAAEITVTAPDGTSHSMIPWKRVTSEGEGQAARAKTEADKAQAAASTAVNVVREAALPLPDVWLPLNDSLRLFTGHGREVKVGDDVVARFAQIERLSRASYFDKNGVWRLAQENEPRFEAKGLLVEGKSSNCIQYADKPAQWIYVSTGLTRSTLPADGLSQAPTGVFVANTPANTHRVTNSLNIPKTLAVGEHLTASCRFKLSDSNINFRLRFANQNGFQGSGLVGSDGSLQGGDANIVTTAKLLPDGFVLATATMTCKDPGAHYAEFLIIGRSNADVPAGCEVRVQLPQVEQLPSRSSFIPSDAAEAVRDADKPFIPRVGNDNYFGPITISAEISCNGSGVVGNIPDARRGIFSGYPNQSAYEIAIIDPSNGRLAWAYGGAQFAGGGNQPPVTDGAIHTVVAQMAGTMNRTYTDGVVGTGEFAAVPVFGADNGSGKDRLLLGYGGGGTQVRHLWGHLRNLRIWHRALSAAQCQALR